MAGYEVNFQQCLRSFSTPDPELKSARQITPNTTFQKFYLCQPWPRYGCQKLTFSVQMLKAHCCCPPFPAGKCSILVNPPSSSINLNFANGQTDRILAPCIEFSLGFSTVHSISCNIFRVSTHDKFKSDFILHKLTSVQIVHIRLLLAKGIKPKSHGGHDEV
jgi:hypothetical protein